jgi:hypothetical protein
MVDPMLSLKWWCASAGCGFLALGIGPVVAAQETGGARTYDNCLTPLEEAAPLLGDYPEFVEPVREATRYEAPALINEQGGDLAVRAWRFSYNARGIIEIPNRLRARETALIVVHPWGIDDGQGWISPEPAGVAFQCTPEKNELLNRHIAGVIDPLLKSLRGKVGVVAYSLPGVEDPIRGKLYRSVRDGTSEEKRREGQRELTEMLAGFAYRGEPLPERLELSAETPVADYFRQFPGLDAGKRFNGEGFWELPIPVSSAIEVALDDVVFYDAEGYEPLKQFLREQGIRHVLLAGYNTDMCYGQTTAGYDNLSPDFNVFLVGDATLATFPGNPSPRFATNAAISLAALEHLVTQVSWIRYEGQTAKASASRTGE